MASNLIKLKEMESVTSSITPKALAIIEKRKKSLKSVVLDWYSVEKWKLCYSSLMFPVNGMELWETHSDIVVMPPPDRIMPGRPKNNDRVKDPSEAASQPSQSSQNSQKAIVVIFL